MPVQRVRKAFEQVADQLREQIVRGEAGQGERLPSETALARDFGVSRATVREALRLLAAQGLIRTEKGVTGGSYVTAPTVDAISGFMESSIALLSDARDVSLDELLEIRELLEVPAARLAAQKRDEEDLGRLRGTIPARPLDLAAERQLATNWDFHSVLIQSCHNTLLTIAAGPIFAVLQANLSRSRLGTQFHRAINEHHVAIADAVTRRSPAAAERQMRSHLSFLRPFYEQAWRQTLEERSG